MTNPSDRADSTLLEAARLRALHGVPSADRYLHKELVRAWSLVATLQTALRHAEERLAECEAVNEGLARDLPSLTDREAP